MHTACCAAVHVWQDSAACPVTVQVTACHSAGLRHLDGGRCQAGRQVRGLFHCMCTGAAACSLQRPAAHLWRCIVGAAAAGLEKVPVPHNVGQTKVCNLDAEGRVQQQVLWLEVPAGGGGVQVLGRCWPCTRGSWSASVLQGLAAVSAAWYGYAWLHAGCTWHHAGTTLLLPPPLRHPGPCIAPRLLWYSTVTATAAGRCAAPTCAPPYSCGSTPRQR
jgi:hypothetical protein